MQRTASPGLANRPTGPELCAQLALTDPHDADDEQLLTLLAAETRQLAYQQARVWAVEAEIGVRDPMPSLPEGARWSAAQIFDSAVDEIRAELRLSRRSAERELANATSVSALRPVAEALSAGVIDRTRALVLADGCWDLTDAQTSQLLSEVLPKTAQVTATALAEQVRRVAVALDPGWAERRYKEAVRQRRVIGYFNRDGSATVSGQGLPADQAAAACARVQALAAAAKRAGAVALIDHLRTELFLGFLDGRFHELPEADIIAALVAQFPPADPPAELPAETPAETPTQPSVAARTGVELRVGLGTLLGRNDEPAEIAGWGTVPASVARTVAERQRKAEWRFAIVDDAGQLVFDGLTHRRPRRDAGGAVQQVSGGIVELHVPLAVLSNTTIREAHPEWSGLLADLAAQYERRAPIEQDPTARFAGRPLRRRVQIKFARCVFPGCRRPASECDLDHRHDYANGGRTDEHNSNPPCRHDHELKTSKGWRLVRRDERTFVWISPLGRKHVVEIEPVAPPLPAPIPRKQPPEMYEWDADPPDPGPILEQLRP